MKVRQCEHCPFCGYTDLDIISDEYKTICWYVSCSACLCSGPVSVESEADAIELWNKGIKE